MSGHPYRSSSAPEVKPEPVLRQFAKSLLGSALGGVLRECRWYRRLVGGHWEQWYTDVVHSDIWHHLPHGARPPPLSRFAIVCEDWP